MDYRPGKLSGGHNHSAAVARELSLSFAIMFGDESRDNLDTKTDDPIYELLKLLIMRKWSQKLIELLSFLAEKLLINEEKIWSMQKVE